MKKKSKDSKLNVALTALLVVFVCLLSFSIGVISGKGLSDRDYTLKHIEQDSHIKMAQEDNEPLGDEMTEREVEILTKRALEQAKAEAPKLNPEEEESNPEVAQADEKLNLEAKPLEPTDKKTNGAPLKEKISTAQKDSAEKSSEQQGRSVSSLMPKPTLPKPTAIEYTVQVASYKTEGEAENHSEQLIDKGFPAFPVKAIINGTDWYRVSIGSFKNKKQAIKYQKALTKQAVIKNSYVRKIERLKK